MKRLAVLISGSGRNLGALIRHCEAGHIPARITTVIANRGDAYGLQRARQAGIATRVLAHGDYPSREAFDAALAAALDAAEPDAVALAGFMRILTPGFIARFSGRLLNIHPSLLPKYPGLQTHRRALEAGDTEHGATVHFVSEDVDGGPAILQSAVRVQPDDTEESLADRVMQEVELKIYPQAVAWLLRGELALRRNRVVFRDRVLDAPLGAEALEPCFR